MRSISRETLVWADVESPVGPLRLVGRRGAIVSIGFMNGRATALPPGAVLDANALAPAIRQLEEYFRGTRREFEVAIDPAGTDFQLAVWRELMRIPYGETRSYGEIARAIGRPAASRAVGAANGANPIPIVVPCHRVIGSGGSLTGFGGGLTAKRLLLELEAGTRSLSFA